MGLAQDINRLLKQRGSPMAGLGGALTRARAAQTAIVGR